MIATEIPAAMRPYSMAVAPLSSAKNAPNNLVIALVSVGRCLIGNKPCIAVTRLIKI
jgi:hypothetical protein